MDVQIWQLPVTQDYKNQRRLLEPRGELTQIVNEHGLNLNHLLYLEIKAGQKRAMHYHKVKVEWFYVIRGKADLYLKDIRTGEEKTVEIAAGSLIKIMPFVYHIFTARQDSQLLEFSTRVFDPNDTDAFPLD